MILACICGGVAEVGLVAALAAAAALIIRIFTRKKKP